MVRRLFSGVAEGIVDVASHPLHATGRRVSKAEVGALRDFGLGWLRHRLTEAGREQSEDHRACT